jgi:hypothetical protein
VVMGELFPRLSLHTFANPGGTLFALTVGAAVVSAAAAHLAEVRAAKRGASGAS